MKQVLFIFLFMLTSEAISQELYIRKSTCDFGEYNQSQCANEMEEFYRVQLEQRVNDYHKYLVGWAEEIKKRMKEANITEGKMYYNSMAETLTYPDKFLEGQNLWLQFVKLDCSSQVFTSCLSHHYLQRINELDTIINCTPPKNSVCSYSNLKLYENAKK